MSIQFRARIKSVADYTNNLSDTGVCCYPDGTQSAEEVSYISCMNDGGYFQYLQVLQGEQPSDVVCPDLSDDGCCCACEYVEDYDEYLQSVQDGGGVPEYTSGLKDVSRCECNRIGGVWSTDSCDTYREWGDIFNLCTGGAYSHGIPNPVEHDRRFPEGCCLSYESGSDVDDGPYNDCVHVCSSRECSDLQDAAWPECCPNIPAEQKCIECPHCCAGHWPTIACGEDPTVPPQDWITCGDENATAYASGGNAFSDDEFNNILVMPRDLTEEDIERRHTNTTSRNLSGEGVTSVCITTEDRIEYDCKIKSKNLCSGIWMGLNDAGLPFKCDDSDVTVIRDFLQNGTVSREVADGWKLGEYHIAGYYAGIFNYGGEDGTNAPVEGFGNPKTGPSQTYTIENDSKDIKEFKSFTKSQYAVLILPNDLEGIFNGSQSKALHSKVDIVRNQSKSKFDSVRNMVTPLERFDVVNSYTYNGVGGWTIPSINVLGFIANQVKKPEFIENTKNNKAYNWSPMNKSYWSSSLIGESLKQSMAYVQDFNKDFVSVCPITQPKHWTRPIRMIKIK